MLSATPDRGDLGMLEDVLDKTFEHDDEAPPPAEDEESPGEDDEGSE